MIAVLEDPQELLNDASASAAADHLKKVFIYLTRQLDRVSKFAGTKLKIEISFSNSKSDIYQGPESLNVLCCTLRTEEGRAVLVY